VATNVLPDSRFTSLGTLRGNDLKDAMRGVALFARKLDVFLQKQIHTRFVGAKDRLELLTRICLERLCIVGKSFSDGNAIASFFPCDLMDALFFDVITPSNAFSVLFVHRHPFLPCCEWMWRRACWLLLRHYYQTIQQYSNSITFLG